MRKLNGIVVLILCCPIPSFAWGPQGHRIVGDLARAHLNQTSREQVRRLIGDDDLASISTWADEIRSLRPQTSGWHFVDIPWNAQGFSASRDCWRPDDQHASFDHHNCVVDRIEMFARVLGDRNSTAAERREALKFLVHFVADVHQPMHAIAEARGGNDIHVVEFGSSMCGSRPCNLHAFWDFGLIEHVGRPEREYVSQLESLIRRQNLQTRVVGGAADWANESFHIAHAVWLPDGARIDEGYVRENVGIADRQLALAGLRLASLLNQILGR